MLLSGVPLTMDSDSDEDMLLSALREVRAEAIAKQEQGDDILLSCRADVRAVAIHEHFKNSSSSMTKLNIFL